MKRFRIIGKTNQMRSVFLRDRDTGKYVQHKITRGKTIEVFEDELTFHVDRQKGYKVLDVVEIPEEIEVFPVAEAVVEEKVQEEAPPQKRGRGKRRKSIEELVDVIDITGDESEGL